MVILVFIPYKQLIVYRSLHYHRNERNGMQRNIKKPSVSHSLVDISTRPAKNGLRTFSVGLIILLVDLLCRCVKHTRLRRPHLGCLFALVAAFIRRDRRVFFDLAHHVTS